jgi:tetratricopeptide (TPR) repeat protein
MRNGFLIVLFALLLSGNFLSAQSISFDPEIRKLYLDLDTVGGNRLLSQRYQVNSPDFVRLTAYREFLKALLNQSKIGTENFKSESSTWIQLLDKSRSSGIHTQVAIAEIRLYRSILAAQISDYKNSATDLITSYKIVARSGMDFNVNDRNKLSGIMGVLFQQIPDQYVKYLKLLGIRSAGLSGYNGLERYYGSALPGSAQRIEGYLLLVISHKEFSQDPSEAWRFIQAEGNPMMENPLIRYQCALSALKAGDCNTAVKLLETGLSEDGKAPFSYWNYQLGRTKLYQDSPESVVFFDKFLSDPGSDNYKHSAMSMAAWYYRIHGQQGRVENYIGNLRNLNAPLNMIDKQALNELSAVKLPNPYLLKMRFLFDGGYYQECLSDCEKMLLAGGISGPEDGELLYRKARSEQRLGKTAAALNSFREVIARADKINSYIVPNSALQMGYIYKKTGQTELARKYYTVCLDLNKFAYRDGISRQAQAALRELDK